MTYDNGDSSDAGVRKHRRSRTGCFTCRKRKKRCDEKKPLCTACKRLSLTCKYPSDSSHFRNSKISTGVDKARSTSEDNHQWIEHPLMTHAELFKPDTGQEVNFSAHNTGAVETNLGSGLHFPLHFSRLEKDGIPQVIPPVNFPPDGVPGSMRRDLPGDQSRRRNDDVNGLTSENATLSIPAAMSDYYSNPINGNHQIIQEGTMGDFLTPMLLPSDVSGGPRNDPLYISRISTPAFTASLQSISDGNNLTVVDELTDPFASALYPTSLVPSLNSPKEDSMLHFKPGHKPGLNNGEVLNFPSKEVGLDSVTGVVNSTTPDDPENSSVAVPDPDIEKADDRAFMQPLPSMGPTTERFCSVYPDLDNKAVCLFNYFRDKQSILMSVSPLNYFRSVFLAFSLRYRAIMYGILAWAAWHKGDEEELAREFFEKSSQILREETINSRSKEEILAALLVLASAKICSGDTSTWRPYLVMAGETIHLHGGLTSFMESESVRWLLKNFAYHEILTSSSMNQPKLFTANDFELIFNQPSSATLPDTLCACCQPVFVVLERINELTRSVRLMQAADELAEEFNKNVENIYLAAHDLEQRIWALQPAHKILQHLSDNDLHLQQTLFDVFKLVAVLHMYQSVLQINSSSISMRVVAQRLVAAMDCLFGTMMEGILTFPLFVLGISSTTAREREYVIEKFTAMEKRLHARNITQARVLLLRVWDRDRHGRLHIDWNELIDRDGLHFCFC